MLRATYNRSYFKTNRRLVHMYDLTGTPEELAKYKTIKAASWNGAWPCDESGKPFHFVAGMDAQGNHTVPKHQIDLVFTQKGTIADAVNADTILADQIRNGFANDVRAEMAKQFVKDNPALARQFAGKAAATAPTDNGNGNGATDVQDPRIVMEHENIGD